MLLRNSGSTINLERRPELHQSVQAVAVEGIPPTAQTPIPPTPFGKYQRKIQIIENIQNIAIIVLEYSSYSRNVNQALAMLACDS